MFSDDKITEVYHEGSTAYLDNALESSCPYNQRLYYHAWMAGFIKARMDDDDSHDDLVTDDEL